MLFVPFMARCPFRQYIPTKPDKYGMKIFWICDAKSFYPLKAKPYLGKEGNSPQQNLGRHDVLELSNPLTRSGRNITMGNYFTDMVLATTLLQNGLTLVGTVRKNKTFIPPACLPSRSREKLHLCFSTKVHPRVLRTEEEQSSVVALDHAQRYFSHK